MTVPSESLSCVFSKESLLGWLSLFSLLRLKCAPRRVASDFLCSKSPKPCPYSPVGVQTNAVETVLKPLSSRDALTPSVLILFPSIAWYLSVLVMLPFTQMPEVYEGRKNSSAIWRLSTPSQNGKLPSVVRTPGSEVMPAARVTYLLNV